MNRDMAQRLGEQPIERQVVTPGCKVIPAPTLVGGTHDMNVNVAKKVKESSEPKPVPGQLQPQDS